MDLLVKRFFFGEKYTIGRMYVDGVYFCDTIEDTVRNLPATCPNTPKGRNCTCIEKVYSETAIPAGTYKVSMMYSKKYGRKMPYLHNVPHFLGILLHSGNDQTHSSGCLIVGENKVKGKVINSRATFQKLLTKIQDEKEIIITIE